MAQGFKVADAYIEIHTEDDTNTGRRKIDRDTTRWARGLGPKLGRIVGLGLLAGIGKALLSALAVTAKLAAFGIIAGTVASAVGGLAAAIANLIPILAELGNALIAASGTLLLLPAAIASIIAVVATAKLGLKGMGEAMKAVSSGDAAALNEALKKLAPNARLFVREIARLKPAFDRLRMNIQQALFAKLARDLHSLARLTMPILNDRLKEMAGVLNGAIRDAIEFFTTRQSRLDLSRILNASARAADNLRRGLVPILQILRDITAVGALLIADLTGGFGAALAGFADKIAQMRESGELRQMILDGLAAAKALVLLLGDIVGIIRSLVRAAGGAGGLFSFFDRLNRLLQSVEGQTVLKELFADLDRIGRALIPVLMALLKALMPVIEGIAGIAEAFAPALTVLLLSLGNALGLLEGPIKALAPLIFELARGLAPIALILGELVKAAAPGLTVFLAALVDALIALVPVAPVVGKALGDLFAALAPVLEALGPALATALVVIATALSAIAKAAGPVIAVFAQIFGNTLRRILPVLLDLAAKVLPLFAEAGTKIAEAFEPLIPVMAQLVQIWLDAILPHMPALVQLFAAWAQIITNFGVVFAKFLLAAMEELVPLLPILLEDLSSLSEAVMSLFVAFQPLVEAILPEFKGKGGDIHHMVGLITIAVYALIGAIRLATVVIQAIAAVVSFFTGGLNKARSGVESFGRAVGNTIGAAIGLFKSLRDKIASAVGNLGNVLFDAGKRVIQGLINGIKAMFPGLSSVMGAVAQVVRDYWPFSPAKRGPLSGRGDLRFAGQNLVGRLVEGISDRLRAAQDASAGLAGLFAGALGGPVPGLAGSPSGVAAAGARGGQPVPGSFGPYRLELDGKVVSEFAIDAVTGAPKLIAATAQEGTRQRTFLSTARRR